MVDFRMPSLGADMEAGTLVEWLVKPGDQVKRGDVVAVVETQKGAIEIEVFETGRVEQILVDLNNKVPVGTPLARIRTELEDKAGVAAAAPLAPVIGVAATVPSAVPAAHRPVTPVTAAPIVSGAGLRARASPAARQMAQSQHVDLAKVTGSGPDGAIVRADIERHLGAPVISPEKKRPTGLDLDAMRIGHRGRHGPIEAGNPALLSAASGRRDALRAVARADQCHASAGRPPAAGGARHQVRRLGRAPNSAHSMVTIAMEATKA